MNKDSHKAIKLIAANGIIAALYIVLTLLTLPISYSYMQVRLSEFLNLLVFFNPLYTFGLTIGCLLANIFSTVGPLDILMGTGATLIACLIMIILSRFVKLLFLNGLIPCLINAIIVPFIIYLSSVGTDAVMSLTVEIYFIMFAWVFLGEFIAIMCFGYPLFMILNRRYPRFNEFILSSRNQDFKI